MFDKSNRYMTRGIINELPVELQLLLWNYIDELKESGKQMDYLQVFRLSTGNSNGLQVQKIIHEQEQPPYRREHVLHVENPLDLKVYVIDDQLYSTMLLSSEY